MCKYCGALLIGQSGRAGCEAEALLSFQMNVQTVVFLWGGVRLETIRSGCSVEVVKQLYLDLSRSQLKTMFTDNNTLDT